jgi:hypothetical protein
MIRKHLMGDEEIIDRLEYRPRWNLGVLYVPKPFVKYKFFITNKRVIQVTDSLFSDKFEDIPLGEIISVNYEKNRRRLIFILGTLLAIGGIGAAAVPNSDVGQSLIAAGIGVLLIIFSLVWAKRGFNILTSNPNVLINIPSKKSNSEIQIFVNKIREVSHNEEKDSQSH